MLDEVWLDFPAQPPVLARAPLENDFWRRTLLARMRISAGVEVAERRKIVDACLEGNVRCNPGPKNWFIKTPLLAAGIHDSDDSDSSPEMRRKTMCYFNEADLMGELA